MNTRQNAEWCRCGHAERALVRMGFQPGDELLEVPDLGRDGRADEKHNANHERIDRNEVLGCRRSKSGTLIGSGTGRNAQRSAESRPGAMNIHAMMVNARSRKFLGVPCNRP
jgi:hypothetical protein